MMNEAKARATLRGLVAAAVMASAAQGCCSSEEHRYVRPETAERPFQAQWTCRDACYDGPRCPFGDNETLESCELTGAPGSRVATCVFRTVECAERPFSGSAVCGRRMDGSGAPCEALRAEVGARLASMAVLEREASAAFVRLARELRAHGAPRPLVARAVRAAWQERRHTRAVSSLAARYGAEVPRWFPRVGAVRTLSVVARENVVEGCTREALGACVAGHQAARARDPAVRAAMAQIAEDEREHALLSWAVHDWVRARSDAAARGALDEALEASLVALFEDPVPAHDALGEPTTAVRRAMVRGLREALAAQGWAS